jgi:hyperosmotically inducible protein
VREAKHIDVDVPDGAVTLRGNVHSTQERVAARGACWAVPGVRQVINELKVS